MRTISSHSDFERVFTQGKRFNHPLMRMIVRAASDEAGPGRVAFAAAKRLGCAPHRNRSKRVLRETARALDLPLRGCDIILFATRRTATAPSCDLVGALRTLCKRMRSYE